MALSVNGRELLKRRSKVLATLTASQRDSKNRQLTRFTRLDLLAPR